MNLVAICGAAGSGKTALAAHLETRGYERLPFAASLKGMLANLLFQQGVDDRTAARMLSGDLKEESTPYLDGRSPRHAMQTLGTEWRDLISKDLWVNVWERTARLHEKVVVDDLRFLHEEARVRALGGVIFRVERSCVSARDHISEREFLSINPDFIVGNGLTLQAMFDSIDAFLNGILG
jgi:hypothetical protein